MRKMNNVKTCLGLINLFF